QECSDEQDEYAPHENRPDQEVEALYSREAFDHARDQGLLTGESAQHGVDTYYRAAERELRKQAQESPETRRSAVLHGVQEIVELAERFHLDPTNSDTISTLVPLEVTEHDPTLDPWPPGRNQICWCASGRKYKKCCGSPANR